jgi:hypothetical protein
MPHTNAVPTENATGNFKFPSPTTGFKNNPSISTLLHSIAPEEYTEIKISLNMRAVNFESSVNAAFLTTRHFEKSDRI